MSEKIDPYLRPIYDALYEMLGFDKVEKLLNKNIIEVAPLAFMRGRKNPNFSPASTAGRTKMMRRTSEASKASTARATAR
jgi:hypothetical protein